MNKLKQLLAAAAMCIIIGVTAQVPQQINYQTVVRSSATGIPVPNNTPVLLRFTIHNDSASGAPVYTETSATLNTNQFGLINTALGINASLSTVDWATGTKWLQVEADVNNTGTYTDMGTTQLNAVPFALYAANAPVSFSGNGTINYMPKFTGNNAIGNSQVYDNGTSVMFGGITSSSTAGNVYIAYPAYNSFKAALEINGDKAWIGFKDSNTINGYLQQNGTTLKIASFNGGIEFLSQANTRMIITPSGLIGVGTASPNADLDVSSLSGKRASGLFANASAPPNFTAGDTGTLAVYNTYTGTNYAYGLTSKAIGTSSYAAYLNSKYCGIRSDVTAGTNTGFGGYFTSSNTNVTNYAATGTANGTGTAVNYGVYGAASGGTTNYGMYCSGNGTYTGTWSSASDMRLKEDVNYLSGGLNTIMMLKPASYHFKANDPKYESMHLAGGLHYGLIAQELEQVVPSVVSNNVHTSPDQPNNKIEYKGVNYTELIPIMINAIQEQQGTITQLNQKVKELQQQLDANKSK
jgi:hypothetical protein